MKKYLFVLPAVILGIVLSSFSTNRGNSYNYYYFPVSGDGLWFEDPYNWTPTYIAEFPNCNGFGFEFCSAGLSAEDVEFAGGGTYVRPAQTFLPVFLIASIFTMREED